MKIKVGDNVKVIAGADKGKTGKVTRVLKKDNRVIVEGVHIIHKHMKPSRTNETGGIMTYEAPIDASNVKIEAATKATKAEKAPAAKTTTKTTAKATEKKPTKKGSAK